MKHRWAQRRECVPGNQVRIALVLLNKVNAVTEATEQSVLNAVPAGKAGFGPLAFLTAVALGSAVAIEFGLTSVLAVLWMVRSDSDEVAAEMSHLPMYCLMFLLLSAVSAAAMYSLMKGLAWRWRAQWAMWASVLAIGVWFSLYR